jgi:hypothetical protein
MRKRWQVLSAIASFGVMGFLAVMAQKNFVFDVWVLAGVGGFAVACGVALWAAIKDHRGKWPAAIALLAFAPFAQRLLEYFGGGARLTFKHLHFLDVQIVICSILVVIAAVVILLMPVPPPDDPLPPARQL